MKPRSVSVGTPDSDWAARAFMRWRTSPMRARPPSATCTTEAPWEALMPDWVSAVTSAFRRVPMARPAASSEAFTMREPEASLLTELAAWDAFQFRMRRAEFADGLLATQGMMCSFYLMALRHVLWRSAVSKPTWPPLDQRRRIPDNEKNGKGPW